MKKTPRQHRDAKNAAGICPICQALTALPYRPFCSKRCADIDLGRWLNQTYSIPAQDAETAQIRDPGLASPDRIKGRR